VFTQHVPFSEYKEEKRQIDIMREIMAVPGLRPRIPAFVPGWMRQLLESLWQNDPEQRPSMQECLVALQNKGRVANKTATHHGINNAVLTRVVYENEPNIPRFLVANFQEVWLGCQDHSKIYVLSVRNATEVLRTESHRDAECVTCLATPNERIAVSGSNKGTLCFWREEKERKQSVTSDAEEKRNSSASTPKEERKGGLLSRLISPRSSSHTLRLSTGDVQDPSTPESVPRRPSTIGRQAGRAVSTCGQCHKQFSAHDLSRASELNVRCFSFFFFRPFFSSLF
jgi:hypothetical protein